MRVCVCVRVRVCVCVSLGVSLYVSLGVSFGVCTPRLRRTPPIGGVYEPACIGSVNAYPYNGYSHLCQVRL